MTRFANVANYPECCALKIAHGLESLHEEDLAHIVEITKKVRDNYVAYANNRVLMAFTGDQLRGKVATYRAYFTKHKRKFKRIQYFTNPKTGNKIHLYVVY